MSTFWLVFQPLRYRCFPFLFRYHQWSVSTESPPFLLLVNKNKKNFFWTQLFNRSLCFIYLFIYLYYFSVLFKRRGTMSVLGMLGPFQPPLGNITPAFSFSLHLHLFFQGLQHHIAAPLPPFLPSRIPPPHSTGLCGFPEQPLPS